MPFNRVLCAVMLLLVVTWMTPRTMAGEGLSVKDEAAFFAQLDYGRPELAAVQAAVSKQDWPAAKLAWAKHLQERTAPRWVWSWRDQAAIKRFLAENGVNLDSKVKEADKVIQREFAFQGVPRKLERDIVWTSKQYEYEWGNVLNRHAYWRVLGLAWWQTGDQKYAADWLHMLRGWLAANPVGKGSPWRSLEVGIRATGWFDVLFLFMEAPGFDAPVKFEMTRSLVEHARFLYAKNGGFKKGNWQTVECNGLACVGIMLPEFKESPEWRKRAFGIMAQHMKEGIYPDGAQYELTPSYHTWVMMEFLHLQRLTAINGYKVPGLADRHEKMFEFLMCISTPDQRFMPHGDAGGAGGRSIKTSMGLGALLYARPDMRYLADPKVSGEWIWLFPPAELAAYGKLNAVEPAFSSCLLPNAQYAIMRTGWKKDDRWLFFDAGPYGGPHSHADQLQILLYSGRDLVLDAGQISYDQPLAKTYFKSAKAHNGLLVNERGPDVKIKPALVAWSIKERTEYVSAKLVSDGVTHQRSVLFVKPDYWVVSDHVSGSGSPVLTRLFHLPQVEVEKDGTCVRTGFKEGDNLWINGLADSSLEMHSLPAAQGNPPVDMPVAAFINKIALPATVGTVLVPFRVGNDIPVVEQVSSGGDGSLVLRVVFKDGRTDWIAMATAEQELKAGDHGGKGIALWVRQDAKGLHQEIIPQEIQR